MRLVLTDEEKAKLDRMWEEMHFVSQDALELVDAFEQLWQFATQDADPSAFEPMRKPINEQAARFRKLLTESEPKHINALIAFAAKAYRRPLHSVEADKLRHLYHSLRSHELPHDEAFLFTLSRIFIAPAFFTVSKKLRREHHPLGSRIGSLPADSAIFSGRLNRTMS